MNSFTVYLFIYLFFIINVKICMIWGVHGKWCMSYDIWYNLFDLFLVTIVVNKDINSDIVQLYK